MHPAFDSLGVFCLYGAALAGLIALILAAQRRWAMVSAALVLAGLGLGPPLTEFRLAGPTPAAPTLTILQHNLKFTNPAPGLLDRLDGHDIVTLQEIAAADPRLDDLPEGWALHRCRGDLIRFNAVLSRHPVLAKGCLDGTAWIRVRTMLGDLTIVSIHLYWPWPHGQAAQVDRLLDGLADLPTPVLLTGDFNQTPWSHTARRIADATGTETARGISATHMRIGGLVRLPIDFTLAPIGWTARMQRQPARLSDHHAVRTQLQAP